MHDVRAANGSRATAFERICGRTGARGARVWERVRGAAGQAFTTPRQASHMRATLQVESSCWAWFIAYNVETDATELKTPLGSVANWLPSSLLSVVSENCVCEMCV